MPGAARRRDRSGRLTPDEDPVDPGDEFSGCIAPPQLAPARRQARSRRHRDAAAVMSTHRRMTAGPIHRRAVVTPLCDRSGRVRPPGRAAVPAECSSADRSGRQPPDTDGRTPSSPSKVVRSARRSGPNDVRSDIAAPTSSGRHDPTNASVWPRARVQKMNGRSWARIVQKRLREDSLCVQHLRHDRQHAEEAGRQQRRLADRRRDRVAAAVAVARQRE